MNCLNKEGGIASVILFCFMVSGLINRWEMREYFEKYDNRTALAGRFL